MRPSPRHGHLRRKDWLSLLTGYWRRGGCKHSIGLSITEAGTEDGAIAVAILNSAEEATAKISQKNQRLRIPRTNDSKTTVTYSHVLPDVQESVDSTMWSALA